MILLVHFMVLLHLAVYKFRDGDTMITREELEEFIEGLIGGETYGGES